MESRNHYLRIIPSLLLSENKLVKGTNFSNHKNAGSPVSTVVAFDSQGADEISLIDIDTYHNKSIGPNLKMLKEISKICSTPITFGGGIKDLKTAREIIKSGAEKIYINRKILEDISFAKILVKEFGGQAVVVGINIIQNNNEYEIYEDNKIGIFEYVKKVQNLGIGEIKFMFVNSEGNKLGLDLNFCEMILEHIHVPCIFEGGIGSLEHLEQAFDKKVKAIALGSLLTFNDYNIVKIKRHLFNKNYKVRL